MPTPKTQPEGGTGLATKTKGKPKLHQPSMWKVVLHNDDYTTMDFVVAVLMAIYGKSDDEAFQIMLNIHHKGIGMCGVFTQEIAETKIAQTHDHARNSGFPLMCSMEPAE